MLIVNPRGGYRYLPGGEPYSSGVVADPGFEIVHVTLTQPCPWRDGFQLIDAHLQSVGRPRAALCGVELRSPRPFPRTGFIEFNVGYRALLEEWGLLVEGENPVARTNVVPAWGAPAQESLFGFSYTIPTTDPERVTFVVAGGGELRGGPMLEAAVIRPGDTSPDGMREKAEYVMRAMSRRLEGLGVGWDQATVTEVYTVHPIDSFVEATLLAQVGAAAIHGLRWFHARPPIDELDFEMDVRGVRSELYLRP
jgi:hypothetical protein